MKQQQIHDEIVIVDDPVRAERAINEAQEKEMEKWRKYLRSQAKMTSFAFGGRWVK